jgi:hypothetical protein
MLTSGFLTVAERKYLDCRVGVSKSYLYSPKFHVTNGFAALQPDNRVVRIYATSRGRQGLAVGSDQMAKLAGNRINGELHMSTVYTQDMPLHPPANRDTAS